MSDFSLHTIFAKNIDARLDLIKMLPQKVLLVGFDSESYQLLSKRFPKAQIDCVEYREIFLSEYQKTNSKNKLIAYFSKKAKLIEQTFTTSLPENIYDIVWCNLSLIAKEEKEILRNCFNTLKKDGMLFTTMLGIDSFKEISSKIDYEFLDMHDIGDMIKQIGFSDVVVDTEKHNLNYQTQECIIQDIEILGLLPYIDKDDILSGSLKALTLEIVYGHAIKLEKLIENTQELRFYPSKYKENIE